MNKKTLNDIPDIQNKRVVLRLDLNVPIKNGIVTSDKRIQASLPTIKYLLLKGCKIVILSHLGRVETLDDVNSGKRSLKPVVELLQKLLPEAKVHFNGQSIGDEVKTIASNLNSNEIFVLENTRYNDVDSNGNLVKAESKCSDELGKFWASLGEVFVNDAFGTAHRKHASNAGIAKNIQTSCVGPLIEKELINLNKVLVNPSHPVVTILGGAKISDKILMINNLLNVADKIIICGGMANTFLKAQGYDLGISLVEETALDEANRLLAKAGNKLVLPVDFNCAPKFEDSEPIYKTVGESLSGLMALDIGTKTIDLYKEDLTNAKTVFWNGPAGVFEFKNFSFGTRSICNILKVIKNNGAFTLIGGGDSAAAAQQLGFNEEDFSFISTGGGASLEYIEGKELPGIASIQDK